MSAGKRSLDSDYSYNEYEEENSKKKIIIIAIVVVVIIAIVCLIFALNSNNDETVENQVNTNTIMSEQMIKTYQGYDVLGKIVIDKINVEQYILNSTEDNALEQGVIKLYGGSLNNYGNFCIAGHNKDGIFMKLEEMEIGDTFTIVEPDFTETKYEIKEIYSVEADDLKCLLQDDEKIEITLITCENASTTRLVVKAEEVR